MTRYQLLKQYNYINAKFKIWAYSFRKFKLNDLWFIYINIFIFYLNVGLYFIYRRIFIMGWYRFLGLTRIFSFSCQKFRPYIIRGKNWQGSCLFLYIFDKLFVNFSVYLARFNMRVWIFDKKACQSGNLSYFWGIKNSSHTLRWENLKRNHCAFIFKI